MEPEWLSYQEVGDRLGITPEAARSRAKRLGWRRQMGNTGRAMVLVALESRPADDRPVTPRSPPGQKPDAGIIKALEAHVETLKEHNAVTEARLAAAEAALEAERSRADEATGALDEARARAGAAEARSSELSADLAAARTATTKAIGAYAALAEPLQAWAAERAKPWWRRLAGVS